LTCGGILIFRDLYIAGKYRHGSVRVKCSLNSKKTSFQVRTTDEIISFKKEGQPEVQLYKYNPEIGNFYQISEMKQYMIGERHVDLYHNTKWTKISA
jgi:hypothetical protein